MKEHDKLLVTRQEYVYKRKRLFQNPAPVCHGRRRIHAGKARVHRSSKAQPLCAGKDCGKSFALIGIHAGHPRGIAKVQQVVFRQQFFRDVLRRIALGSAAVMQNHPVPARRSNDERRGGVHLLHFGNNVTAARLLEPAFRQLAERIAADPAEEANLCAELMERCARVSHHSSESGLNTVEINGSAGGDPLVGGRLLVKYRNDIQNERAGNQCFFLLLFFHNHPMFL